MHLLRECVRTLVEETRSAYRRNAMMKTDHRFSMTRFRTFNERSLMFMYAMYFLEKLGQGSGRVVFLLDSRRALKVATNPTGVDQNKTEAALSARPGAHRVVTRVLEVGPDSEWLISELVRPLSGEAEFEELTGTSWEVFTTTVTQVHRHRSLAGVDERTRAVMRVARQQRLSPGDLTKIMHWGKTADGRAVLLDYGLTRA